jgi:hypothetical protein
VQIASTWFPLIDRYPQTFVPNIFKATTNDFRASTQRALRSPGNATYLGFRVMPQ